MMMMSQAIHPPIPRGVKRAAADDLERDQRLSKRFDLLNIDSSGGKLYIPIEPHHAFHKYDLCPDSQSLQTARSTSQSSQRQESSHGSSMDIEDTPSRIYINDLDAELADDLEPSTPAHPIFLPDIEKHLLGLPSAVIFKPSAEEEQQRREREQAMQVVLYGVPPSLSVSPEDDSVRRAIEEARRRVRQRMPLGGQISSEPPMKLRNEAAPMQNESNSGFHTRDPDAMDMEL